MDQTALITAVTKAESVIVPDARPAIRYIVQARTAAGPLELLLSPKAAMELVAHLHAFMAENEDNNATP